MKKILILAAIIVLAVVLAFVFISLPKERVYETIFTGNETLFVGSGYAACAVCSFDGTNWKTAADCSSDFNNAMHVFSFASNGEKLFAGTGWYSSDIFELENGSWKQIGSGLDKGAEKYSEVLSLAFFQGRLFVGTYPSGSVFVFNGDSWVKSADGAADFDSATHVYSLAVFNGMLIAATSPNAGIFAFNGVEWKKIASSEDLEGTATVFSLLAEKEKLYAGTSKEGTGFGNVFEFNGSEWKKIGSGEKDFSHWLDSANAIKAMVFFNGKLFIGTSRPNRNSYVYSFDGNKWQEEKAFFFEDTVSGLAAFNGKLYAAVSQSGNIWAFDGTNWELVSGACGK